MVRGSPTGASGAVGLRVLPRASDDSIVAEAGFSPRVHKSPVSGVMRLISRSYFVLKPEIFIKADISVATNIDPKNVTIGS